jgi:uncharacterized protein YjbI with pentapeptide repeats
MCSPRQQASKVATGRMTERPLVVHTSRSDSPQTTTTAAMMKSGLMTASAALMLLGSTLPAVAIPQTSACATSICDGQDFSNKDLQKEFYTKGSLKGANFSGSNLRNVTLFGANLEKATFIGADLSLANLGQANLEGSNLTQANLSGAILSSARFDDATIIDGADFTDTIIRRDINAQLCKLAKGTNDKTGVVTSDSLNCF